MLKFSPIPFLLLFFAAALPSQTIDITLPYCIRLDYTFCLMEGAKQDTIAKGNLDIDGKATIVLPEKYAGYRGVGRLSIRDYRNTITMILNGEELISINGIPETDEFMFGNSMENAFISDITNRQRQIMERYGFVRAGLSIYREDDPPYLSLKQEETALENQYAALLKEINDSPLYAARMMEILNCLAGAGNTLYQLPEDVLAAQKEFIIQKLDFTDLYTSGFWNLLFDMWYELNMFDDNALLTESREMLNKANDIIIRREITQSIIKVFTKYGKDNLLLELGTEYLTLPLNGQPAPELKADGASIFPKNSLVVFYETGCGSCHYELEELKKKYSLLTDNNIRVISIAADIDKNIFEETSSTFPWTDKLCDFKGFDGENFINYGIVGTPTFILIDSEGIVRGRYARVGELVK